MSSAATVAGAAGEIEKDTNYDDLASSNISSGALVLLNFYPLVEKS